MAETKVVLPANPYPKAEFLLNGPAVKAHRALLDRSEFHNSLRTAMAHYSRVCCASAPANLDSPNQLQASAMCFQRIQGMNDFVNILLTLAEVPVRAAKPQSDNLNQ